MTLVQDAAERGLRRPKRFAHVDLADSGHARVRHEDTAWQSRPRLQTLLTDGVEAAIGILARNAVLRARSSIGGSPAAMRITIVAIAAMWLVVLAHHGAYATRFGGTGNEEYRAVTRIAVSLVALIAFASISFELEFSCGIPSGHLVKRRDAGPA